MRVAHEVGKTCADEAAAQVQVEQKLDVGTSAQRHVELIDGLKADLKQQANEQQDDVEREKCKREEESRPSEDDIHEEVQVKRENADRELSDDIDVARRGGQSQQVVHDAEVDQAHAIEQVRRDDECLSGTQDKDQFDGHQRGEERISDDRIQVGQASFYDEQNRQEQYVSQKDGEMLQESGEQQKVAFKEAALHEHAQTQIKQLIEDQARTAFLNELREKLGALRDLDDAALQRVLHYASDYQKMRGQLVEEYGNQKLEQIAQAMGPDYRFIRGDRISDQNNQQWTDGIIVREARDDTALLDVVAMAEAKAGHATRRELTASRESFNELSEKERANLRATAVDEFLKERGYDDPGANRAEWARSQNIVANHGAEIEELMRDIHGPDMGQLRKDFERGMPNDGKSDVTMKIDGQDVRVRVSPAQTAIYGITPKDVATNRTFNNFSEKEPNIRTNSINIDQRASEIYALARLLQEAERKYRSGSCDHENPRNETTDQRQEANKERRQDQESGVKTAFRQRADADQARTEEEDSPREAADLSQTETRRQVSASADRSIDIGSGDRASLAAVAATNDQTQTLMNADELERSRELARLQSREIRDLDEAMEVFGDD